LVLSDWSRNSASRSCVWCIPVLECCSMLPYYGRKNREAWTGEAEEND
jgi:hypothetical protein